jgi:hypothetical protein
MKHYPIHRTSGPTLDWSRAVCLTDFSLPWNVDLHPAATEFRALWDEEALHFCFDCIDHDLVLDDSATLKERVLDSDRVEIFFTTDLALAPYYGFEMSPRAEALIYKARHYREIDFDWTCPTLKLAAEIQGEHSVVRQAGLGREGDGRAACMGGGHGESRKCHGGLRDGMILVRAATARFLAELAVAARLGWIDPGGGWSPNPNQAPRGVVCARL